MGGGASYSLVYIDMYVKPSNSLVWQTSQCFVRKLIESLPYRAVHVERNIRE